jgi:4-hydroxybenzoate polyprenyltransferase
MLAWLRIIRIPNLATAAADALAGYLVIAGLRELAWPPAACGLAVGAIIALYAAGIIFNDVCDAELDRHERPERPLPSGLIDLRAASFAAGGLGVAGLILAGGASYQIASPWPVVVAAILAGCIWLYDRHAKGTAVGPVVMGACRSLAWLTGMTAAGGPHAVNEWLIPIGMGIYVAGITLYARDEAATTRQRNTLLAGAVVMLAGLVLAAGFVWLPERGPIELAAGALMPVTTWLVLWSVIGTSIFYRLAAGIGDPEPARIRFAVGNAIMSIITLDAVLVLAACGERWAIVVFCLLAWFLFFKRLVPPT